MPIDDVPRYYPAVRMGDEYDVIKLFPAQKIGDVGDMGLQGRFPGQQMRALTQPGKGGGKVPRMSKIRPHALPAQLPCQAP
jgi:hypothetical protein